MSMKKMMLLALSLTLAAFAGVKEPFKQLGSPQTEDPRETTGHHTELFYITVPQGENVTVYLTNWVNKSDENYTAPDLNSVFDMGADNKYGYIVRSEALDLINYDNRSDYQDLINWSKPGQAKSVTYTIEDDPGKTVQTEAYKLGTFNFEEPTDIYLVMTPRYDDGTDMETIDSFQKTNQEDEKTILATRKIGENDGANVISNEDLPEEDGGADAYFGADLYKDAEKLQDYAGNFIMNVGIFNDGNTTSPNYGGSGDQREFVAIYTEPNGGPLPGSLVAGLVSLGTVMLGKRMKKRH